MHTPPYYHSSKKAASGLSPMGLLLLGCVSVLLLGGLLMLLHGINARSRAITYTLEAGTPLPDAAVLCGIAGAAYPAEMPDLTVVGEYPLTLTTPQGRLALSLERGDTLSFTVEIPSGTVADFEFRDTKLTLGAGTHVINI